MGWNDNHLRIVQKNSSAQNLNFFCHHKHIHMQPMDCLTRYNLLSKISGNLTRCARTAWVEQPGGRLLRQVDQEPVITSQSSQTKDGIARDSFYALIGAHQCSILMDVLMSVLGWLATNVSSTIANLVFSTKADREATPYRLVLDCWEFELCHMVRRCCPLCNQMNQFA